jgi:hypothetical protein
MILRMLPDKLRVFPVVLGKVPARNPVIRRALLGDVAELS